MSSDKGDHGSAVEADTSEKAHRLMVEALRLLDEAREPFAAAYLAQAIDTLRPRHAL